MPSSCGARWAEDGGRFIMNKTQPVLKNLAHVPWVSHPAVSPREPPALIPLWSLCSTWLKTGFSDLMRGDLILINQRVARLDRTTIITFLCSTTPVLRPCP